MLTQTAASNEQSERLQLWRSGLWRLQAPHTAGLVLGITDRTADAQALAATLRVNSALVQAEQVHGASIAVIDTPQAAEHPIPGCDALMTRVPGLALVMRTADCVPLTVWDPVQRMVGIAHVGWRGADKRLPMRLVSAARQFAHSRPRDVWVSVGPSIRACCYEVGQEFVGRFGAFVRRVDGRRMFDLAGCLLEQLRAAGVEASHVQDTSVCTACDTARWYSVRKEGQTTGRLLSFALIRS